MTLRENRAFRKRAWSAAVGAVLAVTAVACGGGADDNARITEDEAARAANQYFTTTLGLFTGSTAPQDFMDLFAPECREGVDPSALAFVVVFMQAFAPELQGIEVEEVDVGALVLEETEEGTLVSPEDPAALRVKVAGEFVTASEFLGSAGFEASETDVAEPVLLVRRNGDVYIGDCSELQDLSSGLGDGDSDPTVTPTGPGSSRDDAVPLGTAAVVDETWRIRVVEADLDAWPALQAASDSVEPPAAGERLLLIRVAAENVSRDDMPRRINGFEFALVGSNSELYSQFDSERFCGLVPDELDAELFPGGTAEGYACFRVPADETSFLLVWDSFFEAETFFALE